MPEHTFMDFSDFQSVWQDIGGISGYHSNPLDLPIDHYQRHLAFIRTGGPFGASDSWEVEIHDVRSKQKFEVSELGEFWLYDDGSVEKQ
jgi:hypothetical protein